MNVYYFNRYGHIDYQVGKLKILIASLMLWYSGFLTYHQELVERSNKNDGCLSMNSVQR
jgi:hypothetical protein